MESAPAGSKPLLEGSIKSLGFIPNLHGVFAESPSALEAYQMLHGLFASSSFNNDELTVIWQTINIEHNCHYCIPAHAAVAQMMKVDESLTAALRGKTAMPTEKLQVLQNTTLSLVKNRGHITSDEMNAFFSAGYNKRNLLDIVLGIAQKVMSNYTNHISNTPIDDAFKSFV